jgi:hypothetical protein
MKNDISYKYSCDYINYNNLKNLFNSKNQFNINLKDSKNFQINKDLFYKPQNLNNSIQKKFIINKKLHNKIEKKPISLEINTKISKNKKSFINYSTSNNDNSNSRFLIQSKPKIYLKKDHNSTRPLSVILVNNKNLTKKNKNHPYTSLKLKNNNIENLSINASNINNKNINKKEKIKSLNLPKKLNLNYLYYNFKKKTNSNINENNIQHSFNNNNYNTNHLNSEKYVYKLIENLLIQKQEDLKLNQKQHFKILKKDISKNEEKVKHIMDSLKRFQRNNDQNLNSKGYIYKFIKERKTSDSYRYFE